MSQPNLTEDLNIVANSNLEITLLDGDLNIIQALDDEPNDVGGLTSAELKAKFDEGPNKIKTFLNESLIPELLAADATEAARAAAEAQREANENQRIENENARIAAEQARTTAESARADAETERAAAESARNTAEQAREAAEQARADETAGIVAQATEQAVIASNAASEASSSASGASTSASAAAASASRASDSASASASSATAAQASADEALSSKNSAKSEADRAKSEADRAAEIVGGDFVKSSEKGAAGGVATLGEDSLLAAAQRPKAGGLYRDDGTTTVEESLTEISTTLQKKGPPAEVRVMGDVGTTVTMTRGSKTLSGTVASTGYATLYPTELGDWTITFTYDGSQKVKVFTLEVIGIVTVYPFVVGNSLEKTSWSDLSIMSKFGVCGKFFKVGDTKSITVNGVSYTVRIIGFNHDTLTSGGTAGMTFQLVNCLATNYQMETSNTNANGWEGCLMRSTTLNSTIYGQLNSDLKAVIKAVNKVSSVGNNSSGLETTSDKLVLQSEIEIFGSTTHPFAGEGKQSEDYAPGNSTIKTVSGSANAWWERSPRSGKTDSFCLVGSKGNVDSSTASYSSGVSFGFCV